MDSDNGGQILDSQRKAAAEIARRRVLAAYGKTVDGVDADSNNTHLKDEPINPRINSESWKRYHSEWQNYYQKYYNDYYSNAAKQYIARERLKDARNQAEEDEIVYALAHASGEEKKTDGLKLREDIRKKATDSAKKTRKLRKFIPLIAGVSVTLLILFLQYNRLIFAPIYAYVSPGNAPASEIEASRGKPPGARFPPGTRSGAWSEPSEPPFQERLRQPRSGWSGPG